MFLANQNVSGYTRSTTYLLMEPYYIPKLVMCIWNELKIDQATTRCSHRHHHAAGYFLMRWYIRWMTCFESMTKIRVMVVKGGCSVKVTGLVFFQASAARTSASSSAEPTPVERKSRPTRRFRKQGWPIFFMTCVILDTACY